MNATNSNLTSAIKLALEDNWQSAHDIVQDLDGQYAAWIHAVLHKIEGDLSNAQYWYRNAKIKNEIEDPKEELRHIMQIILAQDK